MPIEHLLYRVKPRSKFVKDPSNSSAPDISQGEGIILKDKSSERAAFYDMLGGGIYGMLMHKDGFSFNGHYLSADAIEEVDIEYLPFILANSSPDTFLHKLVSKALQAGD